MAKIILNTGIKTGHNITVIAEQERMEDAIGDIKKAIKFLGANISEDGLYKIIKAID